MIISCFMCGGVIELTLLGLLIASSLGCIKATKYINKIKSKILHKPTSERSSCECKCCTHETNDVQRTNDE